MLARVAAMVTAVNVRAHRTPEDRQQLHDLVRASEAVLSAMAQKNVGLERETAYFQQVSQTPGAVPAETARQLHIIDQVTAALHANLTTARRYLADIRRVIEPPDTGA